MAGDYYSGMEEKKRGKPTEKLRVGTTRSGDYASGMEEKKPKPKPKPKMTSHSSAVEGEAQAASREAAKRQAARKAASTVGKGFLRGAARFAGPAGLVYGAYEVGDALKDTKPALALRGKIVDSLFKAEDYKREKAELDALAAARNRGLATRKAREDPAKKSALAMGQISAATYDPKNNEADRNADAAARAKKAAENPRDHREPTPAPKPRNYSTEAADRLKELGLGEDNAVVGRLRERSKMSQKERDKPFGEDNEVLKKLREKGFNFAKGGKISGAARKGKTKGRYI